MVWPPSDRPHVSFAKRLGGQEHAAWLEQLEPGVCNTKWVGRKLKHLLTRLVEAADMGACHKTWFLQVCAITCVAIMASNLLYMAVLAKLARSS